jgi:hypothetical protein
VSNPSTAIKISPVKLPLAEVDDAMPLGHFELIMEGERFRGYKNKNQLTIAPLTPE